MAKRGWGGARTGAGRKRKPIEQHRRQRTRPNYPVKPPETDRRRSSVSGRHPDWVAGLGKVPDTAALLELVDRLWDQELEAAWLPETEPRAWELHAGERHGNRPTEARIVARIALGVWLRQWRREWAPEYAASEGVPTHAIVDHLGRAPKPDGEVYPPPTEEDVREVLADGWLLRFWRRESVDA